MTEMTLTVSVPVDVSRDALGLWVAGQLNFSVGENKRFEDVDPKEIDLLDEMDNDVDVTWEASDGNAIES